MYWFFFLIRLCFLFFFCFVFFLFCLHVQSLFDFFLDYHHHPFVEQKKKESNSNDQFDFYGFLFVCGLNCIDLIAAVKTGGTIYSCLVIILIMSLKYKNIQLSTE